MRSANLPVIYVFDVTWSGIEPRPHAPQADAVTTVLRRGGTVEWDSDVLTMCSKRLHKFIPGVESVVSIPDIYFRQIIRVKQSKLKKYLHLIVATRRTF